MEETPMVKQVNLIRAARAAGGTIVAFAGPHEPCDLQTPHTPHKARAAYPTVRHGWQQPYCNGGHSPLTGERDLYGLDDVYFVLPN